METRRDDRIAQLLQALKRSDKLHLKEAATLLGVSEMTIRRDLNSESAPVVLLGVPDRQWGVRVVAVTTGDWRLEDLLAGLRGRLGRAGLPKELRRVPELAYTSTGKIDRTALQAAWQDEG